MKPFILLFSVILFTSCYEPQSDCKSFQEGIFEFETLIEGELVKTRFDRRKDIEIETFRGKIDTASIRWVNDCEYVLRLVNPKKMADEKPMHFKILTTDKNSYTFEYNIVGENAKQKGRAFRVDN